MSSYRFDQALAACFLARNDALRAVLPPNLRPLEARPGHGLVVVTAFNFTDSEVGPYGELVMAVMVPPFTPRDESWPESASYPFDLVTNTLDSRDHAAGSWYLPARPKPYGLRFSRDGERRSVDLYDEGTPVLSLSVKHNPTWERDRLYQVFTRSDGRLHRVALSVEGSVSEHNEETGRLTLYDHPIADRLADLVADDEALFEQSMDDGLERFLGILPHEVIA